VSNSAAVRPALRCDLDLLARDQFTDSLGKTQGICAKKDVVGNVLQRRASHPLFGTTNKVKPTFLRQGAIPLSGKDARILKQLVEHS
jgi:hypothetical protein